MKGIRDIICGCLSPKSNSNVKPKNTIKPTRNLTPTRQMNNDSSNPIDIVVDFATHGVNKSNESSDDNDNGPIPIQSERIGISRNF